MKLRVDLSIKGRPTNVFCSQELGKEYCEKLDNAHGKCDLFKKDLEYNWGYHSYERCKSCKESEIK
jgi:hypothetical protein